MRRTELFRQRAVLSRETSVDTDRELETRHTSQPFPRCSKDPWDRVRGASRVGRGATRGYSYSFIPLDLLRPDAQQEGIAHQGARVITRTPRSPTRRGQNKETTKSDRPRHAQGYMDTPVLVAS